MGVQIVVQNKLKRSVAFLAIPNKPKYYRWHIPAPTYQVLDTPSTTIRHINVSKCSPISQIPSPPSFPSPILFCDFRCPE